jgi:hypothetical protein
MHIMKAERCVGKVGSSLQYDHRLAVSQNFKGSVRILKAPVAGGTFEGRIPAEAVWCDLDTV